MRDEAIMERRRVAATSAGGASVPRSTDGAGGCDGRSTPAARSTSRPLLTTCGVWPSPRGLVAVLCDGLSSPPRCLRVATTAEAQWAFALHLERLEAAVVLPDGRPALAPAFVEALHRSGRDAWLVAPALVDALRQAAGIQGGSPVRSAALLGRLPHIPLWRERLRRAAGAATSPSQMCLWSASGSTP